MTSHWTLALDGDPGSTPPDRTLVVVDRDDEPRHLAGHVLAEPWRHGTGVAVYAALALIRRVDADAVVAIVPLGVVGRLDDLWDLGRRTQPELLAAVAQAAHELDDDGRFDALTDLYASCPVLDFQRDVLARDREVVPASRHVMRRAAEPVREMRRA